MNEPMAWGEIWSSVPERLCQQTWTKRWIKWRESERKMKMALKCFEAKKRERNHLLNILQINTHSINVTSNGFNSEVYTHTNKFSLNFSPDCRPTSGQLKRKPERISIGFCLMRPFSFELRYKTVGSHLQEFHAHTNENKTKNHSF